MDFCSTQLTDLWVISVRLNLNSDRNLKHLELRSNFEYHCVTYGGAHEVKVKGKGKGYPCTGTEAPYRPYGS